MFALIKAGIVVNVIVADHQFIDDHGATIAEGGEWVNVTDASPRPGPGWTYQGGKFEPPSGE